MLPLGPRAPASPSAREETLLLPLGLVPGSPEPTMNRETMDSEGHFRTGGCDGAAVPSRIVLQFTTRSTDSFASRLSGLFPYSLPFPSPLPHLVRHMVDGGGSEVGRVLEVDENLEIVQLRHIAVQRLREGNAAALQAPPGQTVRVSQPSTFNNKLFFLSFSHIISLVSLEPFAIITFFIAVCKHSRSRSTALFCNYCLRSWRRNRVERLWVSS
ncbi:hypothetical protein PR048_020053 [Dryococelus australis]|uniref:Uncharacterized protein n=1 Tax=Dryococelus australis TaxID=614101 RepID=A0ABQ9H5B6_9NEOP|nr:hypothetical protein PR048_020053 [Dryococelus australis]